MGYAPTIVEIDSDPIDYLAHFHPKLGLNLGVQAVRYAAGIGVVIHGAARVAPATHMSARHGG